MLDLEKNLLTTVLIAASGLFGFVGLVFVGVYFLTDVRFIAPAPDQALALDLVEPPDTGLEALSAYSAIVERPVFFPDRQLPVVEVADAEGSEEESEPEPEVDPVDPLQAVVAGIIIAPDYRAALVNDRVADDVVILREGMSLKGDQAPWRLTEIEPERVRFVSSDGQQTDLALKVHTDGLPTGSSSNRTDDAAAASASEEAQSRADLIRQRVAERRAELRARAERRAAQQQAARESTPEPEQTQQQPQ